VRQVRLIECHCNCGSLILDTNEYGDKRSFINGHQNRGIKNPRWKGGRYHRDGWYILVYLPNYPRTNYRGYILEHIVVYETFNKCCLLSWVILHHKDGNRQNNNISNLEPMTRDVHARLHNEIEDMNLQFKDRCVCGSRYIFKNGIRGDRQTFTCGNCGRNWMVMLSLLPAEFKRPSFEPRDICNCGSKHIIKQGLRRDKQRFKCVDCGKKWSVKISLLKL
jgi:transposase-like protein